MACGKRTGWMTAILRRMILERQRERAVDLILSRSREVQASGDIDAALTVIEKGLVSYPDERRHVQRKDALVKIVGPAKRPEEKEKDLNEMRELKNQMREAQ